MYTLGQAFHLNPTNLALYSFPLRIYCQSRCKILEIKITEDSFGGLAFQQQLHKTLGTMVQNQDVY